MIFITLTLPVVVYTGVALWGIEKEVLCDPLRFCLR